MELNGNLNAALSAVRTAMATLAQQAHRVPMASAWFVRLISECACWTSHAASDCHACMCSDLVSESKMHDQ